MQTTNVTHRVEYLMVTFVLIFFQLTILDVCARDFLPMMLFFCVFLCVSV